MCERCNGAGLIAEKKLFEVHVEKGMRHGQKIVLRGEAGTNDKTLLPGDIVFVLEQKDNNTGFERASMDLIYEKEITLYEALGGSKFYITHLDKRVLEFGTAPGRPQCLYAGAACLSHFLQSSC